MIWSVSMSVRGSTTVRDVMLVKASMLTMNSRGSRGSVTPRTADAAAVSGLASSVRAPTPWRPSKLRLLVLSEYWPFATVSPFMPRHIEQPDSRHSAPASMNTRSSPSASACFLICCEPGTTSICTPRASLWPFSTPGGGAQVGEAASWCSCR